MATKVKNTNSTPRKQTKKGFTFPSIPAYSLSLSLSLSLSFILSPISSYNVIILLPHLTIFSMYSFYIQKWGFKKCQKLVIAAKFQKWPKL